jgi:hypothetical protein
VLGIDGLLWALLLFISVVGAFVTVATSDDSERGAVAKFLSVLAKYFVTAALFAVLMRSLIGDRPVSDSQLLRYLWLIDLPHFW